MPTRQLSLADHVVVRAAEITAEPEIHEALNQLGIPFPNSVIVLVGGASGMRWLDKFAMRRAIRIVARLAEETHSVVVDGGTLSGIMAEIGKQRQSNQFSFPLIGVVFEKLLERRAPQTILDPNHTHFLLVPGEHWGDESFWIAKIATKIAEGKKSITILVNGGEISKQDVGYSSGENRSTFVIRGTGRLADKMPAGEKIIPLHIWQRSAKLLDYLRTKLS